MVLKYMIIPQINQFNAKISTGNIFVYYIKIKEDFVMLKFLGKLAEKYAKSTNTACGIWFVMHQPKMPASLIKKD